MLSATCFNLEQSKILSSGHGLIPVDFSINRGHIHFQTDTVTFLNCYHDKLFC